MRRQLTEVQMRLVRAICRIIALHVVETGLPDWERPSPVVEAITSEPWASEDVAGQRHRLEFCLYGEPSRLEAVRSAIEAAIGTVEIDVPGYLLADFQLVQTDPDDVPDNAEHFLVIICEALIIGD